MDTSFRHFHTGCLLVNLGTPEAPTPAAVSRYLREFLFDPRVVDMPALWRWMLVNLIIAPFRSPRSARAYLKIWTEEGSPLLVHSQHLLSEVRALFPSVPIELGMRYGTPSLESALEALRSQGVNRIIVLPLYPQAASSVTGSTLERVFKIVSQWWNVPSVQVVSPFFAHPGFINAFAEVARPVLAAHEPEFLLFSFHGLPERHIKKGDCTQSHCLESLDCCSSLHHANRDCYRAQCFATAREIAHALGLEPDSYGVSFQSRLGKDPWIGPSTDHELRRLAEKGVKQLAVMCPAFTADCLETLEEIGMRARESFIAFGGKELSLIPSLNATPSWVRAVGDMLAPHLAHPLPVLGDPSSLLEPHE